MTGAELRRLRERAGLTQEGLARLSDVTTRTIIRWENNQVPIPALSARGLLVILAEKKVKN
jgi:transcriptional regulator with XRE-family HTH domain